MNRKRNFKTSVSTYNKNSATSAKTNAKNNRKKKEKSIISREERIFLRLILDLCRSLDFFF